MYHSLRPTTSEVGGIFLIEEGKLLALDEIMESQFKELKKLRKKDIDREFARVKKQFPNLYPDDVQWRKSIAESYKFKDEYLHVEIGKQ